MSANISASKIRKNNCKLYKTVEGLFSNVIPAASGIYIVKADNKAAKFFVK